MTNASIQQVKPGEAMAFLETFNLILKWEGVYDNDPDDPGGETCFGITRVYEPTWDGWPIVDELKAAHVASPVWPLQARLMERVKAYYQGVFNALNLDYCPSDKLDSCIMGGWVNQGPRVERWLQEAILELGIPVVVDGHAGLGTMNAVSQVLKNPMGETALLHGLMIRRVKAYGKSKPKYIAGLLNRLFSGA